jgi:hypothetical protein
MRSDLRFSGAVGILLSIVLCTWSAELSTFTGTDGKARTGKLIRMTHDTLVIETTNSDGTVVERRAHKSLFKSVVLPDKQNLDLKLSEWPKVVSDGWDDLAPAVQTVSPSPTPVKAVEPHLDTVQSIEKIFIALLSAVTFEPSPSNTIAVFPCSVSGPVPVQAGLAMAELGITALTSDKRFTPVERTEFKKIASELALSQSGIIDEAKAIDAGKQLAARYLLIGTITEERGMRMVSARIITTETGAVVAAVTGKIVVRDMDKMTKDIFAELASPGGALFRSIVLPGWGQFYTGHKVRGGIEVGGAIAGAGMLVYSFVALTNARQDAAPYINRTQASYIPGVDTPESWLLRANNAIARENRMIDQCTYTGVLLGTFWAINLADAYICGARESAKVRKLYFSFFMPPASTATGLTLTVAF